MKKTLFIVMQLISASGMIIGCYSAEQIPPTPTGISQQAVASAVPAPTSTPFSGELVRLAWFYKPPENGQLDLIVESFDFFILTHKDESERSQLKAKGVTSPFSQYLLFLVINDPQDCDERPNGNQVAYKPGDFCQISELHPDWFLLDQNGNRIVSRNNNYYMDPGNEGFRAFWLERARELQESYGWDNIFIDNVEASRTKMVGNGGSLVKYPDDESYQRAVEGFLAYIRQNYFQPKGKPMYGNIVSVKEDFFCDHYLQYLDGAIVESFATYWSDGYRSKNEWEQQMQQVERALSQGKILILVAQGQREDAKLQNFAFASYLLIANGNAVFRYTYSGAYREPWLYENYDLEIGMPVGNRYKDKDGWRRDFTNGHVIVNPKNHHAEIIITP
jgi:hypothetical protein